MIIVALNDLLFPNDAEYSFEFQLKLELNIKWYSEYSKFSFLVIDIARFPL